MYFISTRFPKLHLHITVSDKYKSLIATFDNFDVIEIIQCIFGHTISDINNSERKIVTYSLLPNVSGKKHGY